MRLWAIQLQIPSGKKGATYPQVIVEADDVNEAWERAKERFRKENPASVLDPDDIKVHASSEIGPENIWIFNDERFRDVEKDVQPASRRTGPRK